jgi:hypothetical protein
MAIAHVIRRCTGRALLMLAAWGAPIADGGEIRYRVQRIIPHGSDCLCNAIPDALNALGQVTGSVDYYNLETVVPFVTAENAKDYDLLEQFTSYGIAHGADVNAAGDFVGYSITQESASIAFLLHHEEGLTILGGTPPGTHFNDVTASNDSNQIVGSLFGGTFVHAFRWDRVNGAIDLGDLPGGADRSEALAINNQGVIVGVGGTDRGFLQQEAFIWDEADGMRLLGEPTGGLAEDAVSIGDNGLVAGTAVITGQFRQPYIWTAEGGFTLLGYMAGTSGPAFAMGGNSRGQVVGYGRTPAGALGPFVADVVHGVRELLPLLDPCVANRHRFMHLAHDINEAGMILVSDSTDGDALLLTPYLLGDLDADGTVESQDLATLLANFGSDGGATFADGDSDCDGDVDLQDLATLLANFGASLP